LSLLTQTVPSPEAATDLNPHTIVLLSYFRAHVDGVLQYAALRFWCVTFSTVPAWFMHTFACMGGVSLSAQTAGTGSSQFGFW
jgi:hypothetical protein